MMSRCSIAIFTILLVPGCFGARDEAPDTQGLNSHVSVTCDANTEKATLEMNEASAKVVRVFAEESDALRKRLRYLEDLEEKDDAKATEYRVAHCFEFWGLGYASITDSDAERLAREQSELRILNISGDKITDAGLMHLAQCPRLEVLIINEIGSTSGDTLTRPLFTPAGLRAFQAKTPTCVVRQIPPGVLYGYLDFTRDGPFETREFGVAVSFFGPITKELFDAVKDFHEVQWFKAPEYTKYTPRNAMTDKSMQILARFPRLEALHVAGAERITDVGLGYFVGHPKIEYIRIQATSVTEEGVRMFRHAMPHVSVFYSQIYVDGQ